MTKPAPLKTCSPHPSRVPQPSPLRLRGLTFPSLLARLLGFVPLLQTSLISTLLPSACATRINVPIVRLRGSFSIAEIFGAFISARAASLVWLRFAAASLQSVLLVADSPTRSSPAPAASHPPSVFHKTVSIESSFPSSLGRCL